MKKVYITDEIGGWSWTNTLEYFKEYHNEDNLNVIINSPGGSMFEGIAIYNFLKSKKNVVVDIIGMAASSASIIAMAGKQINMHEGSTLMIHNPWTFAAGDYKEMQKNADDLEKFRDLLVEIYEKNSKLDKEMIIELLNEETWMNADDAIDYGFNVVKSETKAVASANFNISRFKNTPKSFIGSKSKEPVKNAVNNNSEKQKTKKDNSVEASEIIKAEKQRVKDILALDPENKFGEITKNAIDSDKSAGDTAIEILMAKKENEEKQEAETKAALAKAAKDAAKKIGDEISESADLGEIKTSIVNSEDEKKQKRSNYFKNAANVILGGGR